MVIFYSDELVRRSAEEIRRDSARLQVIRLGRIAEGHFIERIVREKSRDAEAAQLFVLARLVSRRAQHARRGGCVADRCAVCAHQDE